MTPVALHHVVAGLPDRPTVLLLGGLGTDNQMWDRQIPALTERFHVVAADLRGHGGSPVPRGPYELDDLVDLVDDVSALLDHLAVPRAHAVGLSLGGMIAMRLAVRRPDRVDRLALLCTSASLSPPRQWTDRAEAVRAKGTAPLAAEIIGRWLTPAGREAQLVQRLEAMIAATPDEGYAACCEVIGAVDLRADLQPSARPPCSWRVPRTR